jgi:hypothetical protein
MKKLTVQMTSNTENMFMGKTATTSALIPLAEEYYRRADAEWLCVLHSWWRVHGLQSPVGPRVRSLLRRSELRASLCWASSSQITASVLSSRAATTLVGALFRVVKSAASRVCGARDFAGFVPTTSVTD